MRIKLPVVVPVHNNHSLVVDFVEELLDLGFSDFRLIDSASTNSDTRKFLKKIENKFNVFYLDENLGPRYCIHSESYRKTLPNLYFLSDPDIRLSKSLPENFVEVLIELSIKFNIGKVGVSLKFEGEDIDLEKKTVSQKKVFDISAWESQYYNSLICFIENDPVYLSSIDTTFCLVNQGAFDLSNELKALRIGGRFESIHLPWMKEFTKNNVTSTSKSDIGIYSDWSKIDLNADQISIVGYENYINKSDLEHQVQDLKLYNSYLKIQIENLGNNLDYFSNLSRKAFGSNSWKITKPLRWLARLLRKIS